MENIRKRMKQTLFDLKHYVKKKAQHITPMNRKLICEYVLPDYSLYQLYRPLPQLLRAGLPSSHSIPHQVTPIYLLLLSNRPSNPSHVFLCSNIPINKPLNLQFSNSPPKEKYPHFLPQDLSVKKL